jgi:sucrose-6-phosphate hydrolase SacC (GH32 family)
MFAYPVKEIEKLYSKKYTWENYSFDAQENLLQKVESDLLDIKAEFIPGQSDEFGFVINGIPVIYDQSKEQLRSDEVVAKLLPMAGKIKLRILVDRLSVEVFANDGQIYMPVRALHDNQKKGFEIFSKNSNTEINVLEIHQLKSIWQKRKRGIR